LTQAHVSGLHGLSSPSVIPTLTTSVNFSASL
jgi:hypothetical protein